MNVRFKKTNKGEVAILPRKEYEVLAAKAREARRSLRYCALGCAGAQTDLPMAYYSFRNKSLIESPTERTRCARSASGAVKRSSTSRTRLRLERVTFPTWKADGEREQLQL